MEATTPSDATSKQTMYIYTLYIYIYIYILTDTEHGADDTKRRDFRDLKPEKFRNEFQAFFVFNL